MSTTKPKKKFDNQRNRLHAIAKEFAEKIKGNPGVAGVVAKPRGTYLHLIVLFELDVPRDLEFEVYDSYSEIFDKYDDGEITFEFDPMTSLSPDTIDEMAYDDANNIIYRKGKEDAKRDDSHVAS